MSAPKFVVMDHDGGVDDDCPDANEIVSVAILLTNRFKDQIMDEARKHVSAGMKSGMIMILVSMLLEDFTKKMATKTGGAVLAGHQLLRKLVDDGVFDVAEK